VTSTSICKCKCGVLFTIKGTPGHYNNVCKDEKSVDEIKTFKALSYERLKRHRSLKTSKVMQQKHNRHYSWLNNNEEPDMKPETINTEVNYDNCWFVFPNKSDNLLHYAKAGLGNTTDILLSFRLLADWLVDMSSGRVRLLKDQNINKRADLWKYNDLNNLLVIFHPDSAKKRLTYKMTENIKLCTGKVLTWFFLY